MPKPSIRDCKIVVLSGAGISAESGLPTFRDHNGLWHNHSIYDVATPEGWAANPELVLEFYNERRAQAAAALPNPAHQAVAELERCFEVVVITQNIDDLHEKAGSSCVIHVHGELSKARSTIDPDLTYPIGDAPIRIGDQCAKGSQLRPHVVWFGEEVLMFEQSLQHIMTAGKVLVVGTSLTVFPIAGLVRRARHDAEKLLVSLEIEERPFGYKWMRGRAADILPPIAAGWLADALKRSADRSRD
jgi:NAD-dependent protein deacetylase/lipoamidase